MASRPGIPTNQEHSNASVSHPLFTSFHATSHSIWLFLPVKVFSGRLHSHHMNKIPVDLAVSPSAIHLSQSSPLMRLSPVSPASVLASIITHSQCVTLKLINHRPLLPIKLETSISFQSLGVVHLRKHPCRLHLYLFHQHPLPSTPPHLNPIQEHWLH